MTDSLAGLSHLSFNVSNLEAAVDFYTEVLGFTRYQPPEVAPHTAWLHHNHGSITIHLTQSTDKAQFGFTLVSADIENVVSILNAQGVKFESSKKDGITCLSVCDPSGNLITLTNTANAFSTKALKPTPSAVCASPAAKAAAGVDGPVKRLAVLTSGGDSQGMNAAYRAVVRTAIYRGCEVFAIHEGYQGLVDGGHYIQKVDWEDVTGIIHQGGTHIGTARCKEMRTREGRLRAAKNLLTRGVDGLVIIGGDGSLTGANLFRKEWPDLIQELAKTGEVSMDLVKRYEHLAIVGMVGSIDNDMCGTDMTIGCDTALHRIVEAVDSISATAASHQRAFVVEVMGRNCGWLALMAVLATGADWVFIPEAPVKAGEWEDQMCAKLKQNRDGGKRRTIVIVAEGALDSNNQPVHSEYIRKVLEERLHFEARVTILGHVQRGGTASAYDRYLGTVQGSEAVEVLLTAKADDPAYFIGVAGSTVTRVPLVEAVAETQKVAEYIKSCDVERALKARGPEYVDAYNTYIATTLSKGKCQGMCKTLRIAVVHVGAPAGGSNIATRVAVRHALDRGHQVFGVYDGFQGLIQGNIRELLWMDVDGWGMQGGSKLGTNRTLPADDMGMVAFQLQKFDIQALIIVGGFEGFHSLKQLEDGRPTYPAFRIPMVLVPATISNNVPGTEFTLGCDTALNTLVSACDQIKQSASSSRRRAFVVDCMGGNCGYLATMAGIAVGAITAYIPEEGVTLARLHRDSMHLIQRYRENPNEGRILLRNENASSTYTTEVIAAVMAAEGQRTNSFDCKVAQLGHIQQGGCPTPLDRIYGVRFGTMAVDFVEEFATKALDENSIVVVGTKGQVVEFTPVRSLLKQTDFVLRKYKQSWWLHLLPMIRMMGKYSNLGDPNADSW